MSIKICECGREKCTVLLVEGECPTSTKEHLKIVCHGDCKDTTSDVEGMVEEYHKMREESVFHAHDCGTYCEEPFLRTALTKAFAQGEAKGKVVGRKDARDVVIKADCWNTQGGFKARESAIKAIDDIDREDV